MNESNNGSKYGGLLFDDIVDAHSLAIKLHERATPLCAYLMVKFSAPGRDAIDKYGASPADAEKLKPVLAEELRQIIKGGSIYDPARFPDDGLRPITKAVLRKHPRGLDVAWANRLLLRDAFRAELACESATLVAEWAPEGINCRVNCEPRQLTHGIGFSFKIAFKTLEKWDSEHAKTLENARAQANAIAARVHTGTVPAKKSEAKERDAKAEAFDAILKKTAEAGATDLEKVLTLVALWLAIIKQVLTTGVKDVLDFVKDAVKAQNALGPKRPLLEFVQKAMEVMPKPEKRILLRWGFRSFRVYHGCANGGAQEGKREMVNLLGRFMEEIPACEKLIKKLEREAKLTGQKDKDEAMIDELVAKGLAVDKPASFAGKSPEDFLFKEAEIMFLPEFIAQLRESDPESEPVFALLWKQFSVEEQLLLKADPSAPVSAQMRGTVVAALNRIIGAPSSSEISACAGVPWRDETRKLLRRHPQGAELARLNRLLVEDAYPELRNAANIYADNVTARGINLWLKLGRFDSATGKNYLGYIRRFQVYLRDVLQALPAVAKTAAHQVPLPKRKGKTKPVSIWWYWEVWGILLNLQDLESLFFIAIGVFAGLHETEILRLVWEFDIIWEDDRPIQIFIASGIAKDPQGTRPGQYVDIRHPLDKILLLGKGLSGNTVKHKNTRKKIRPLLRRLGIVRKPSIMRHTNASHLKGIGLTLEEVAGQLRDLVGTLLRCYIRQLTKPQAGPLWELPVDISFFAGLPKHLADWDHTKPLRTVARPAWADAVVGAPATVIAAPGQTAPFRRRIRHVMPEGFWPPDDEFIVMRYDKSQEKIARKLDCSTSSVCEHAADLGLKAPDNTYWKLGSSGIFRCFLVGVFKSF